MNTLDTKNWSLEMNLFPKTEFTVTGGSIPGITINPAIGSRPKAMEVPYTGDTPIYEPLEIEFLVSEDLSNWIELFEWFEMVVGPPENIDLDREYTDASVILRDSHGKRMLTVRFHDCTCAQLGRIPLSYQDTEKQELKSTLMLEYDHMSIDKPK